jgi:hypothetical protein
MNFRGNKIEQFMPGTRLGPDAHGIQHEVTSATYDKATNTTKVRTRKLEIDGGRLRFTGERA